MHRTEGANATVGNLFTDGPPGTRCEEDFLNAVQEEIAYVVEQSNLTLKTAATETRQQLKAAIDLMIATPGTITLDNTGLHILDTDASHDLIIKVNDDLSADRTLNIDVDDGDRTLNLFKSLTFGILGSPGGTSDGTFVFSDAGKTLTVDDDCTLDQNLRIADGPTFTGITINVATENIVMVDAGSVAATQQDWIEVTVGGNQGYIHVFAAK